MFWSSLRPPSAFHQSPGGGHFYFLEEVNVCFSFTSLFRYGHTKPTSDQTVTLPHVCVQTKELHLNTTWRTELTNSWLEEISLHTSRGSSLTGRATVSYEAMTLGRSADVWFEVFHVVGKIFVDLKVEKRWSASSLPVSLPLLWSLWAHQPIREIYLTDSFWFN